MEMIFLPAQIVGPSGYYQSQTLGTTRGLTNLQFRSLPNYQTATSNTLLFFIRHVSMSRGMAHN